MCYDGLMSGEKKVPITITISPEMLEKVEDYWHSERLRSRSEAVGRILEAGLDWLCREQREKKAA